MANLEVRAAGNDVLVYDSAQNKVHVLNTMAGYILEQCDGERSPQEIARAIAEVTNTEYATVENDVDATLRKFTEMHLVA